MSRHEQADVSGFKHFAWNGFSMRVPDDWNLAYYTSLGDSDTLRLEDDDALRMELDWVRSSENINPETVQKRYAKLSKELIDLGAELDALENLPSGWVAFLYTMPDKRRLLSAFSLFNNNRQFCFLRIHFEAASRREPIRILNAITSTFKIHSNEPIPWEVYDVSFSSPEKFKLVNTSFNAGRKIFSFVWNLRRLYYMFFSLGDMALRTKGLEEWCAEFLNDFPEIKGPAFFPGQNGVVNVRRSRKYPIGHMEEIFRRCFKYKVRCKYDQEKNQIAMILFNYRALGDLTRVSREL